LVKKKRGRKVQHNGTVVSINRADPPFRRDEFTEQTIAKGTAGSQTRYSRIDDHPLSQARRAGRINDLQYHAGELYRETSDLRNGSGRDSTDLERVSGRSGFPITEAQCDAIKWIICVEWLLSDKDRRIIRAVCGEGRQPSEAVRAVEPNFSRTVSEVFRHSLDALAEAIEKARKMDYRLPVGE
jgi:hypothetical protein